MSFMSETTDFRPGMGLMHGMAAALGAAQTAFRARADYDRLARLTDAELAARGLSRDTLAETLFARHYRGS